MSVGCRSGIGEAWVRWLTWMPCVLVLLAGCGRSSLLGTGGVSSADAASSEGGLVDGAHPDAGEESDADATDDADAPDDGGGEADGAGEDGSPLAHDADAPGDGYVQDDGSSPPADGAVPADGALAVDGALTPDGAIPPEVCNNQLDDDANGLIDCDDPACASIPICRREICDNWIDDNGDGLVDCEDPTCFGTLPCLTPGEEICNNGIDDNDNGLVDCQDDDCRDAPICRPTDAGQELCDNGIDDDGNGAIDCADPACVALPACLGTTCAADVDFGLLPPHGASVSRSMSTLGTTTSFHTCAAPGGTARVGRFQLGETSDVRLDFSQTGGAHVISLHRAGVNQACDQNPVYCLRVGQQHTATHSFPSLSAGTYWIIVQSYYGTQSDNTVTLSTGSGPAVEDCDNGADDDGNGLVDCADMACRQDANCAGTLCVPDLNLGSLIVDDPTPKVAHFDTAASSNRYHPTCAGSSTGNDYVVRFTLKETAQILVHWSQTGDHVFGLFTAPPPGQPCDAYQTSCYYPGGWSGGAVAWQARPPGDYLFILKSLSPQSEGVMDLRIWAVRNRQVEVCNNGFDDDGNGLVDCDDPVCFGVGQCVAPVCIPDLDVGDIGYQTSVERTIDTSDGIDLYRTRCARGDGKAKVVRLNLLQPMALGFDCANLDGADNILQLDAQVDAYEQCDEHLLVCADPKVMPFGCYFVVPNLQAGRYNVIVSAFQAGGEGSTRLRLFGYQENVLENCNNGIDDDGDGHTDCADAKCATSPFCANQCRAGKKLGLVPLAGDPLLPFYASTLGEGDDQTETPCVTAPGGEDTVVDFELPGQADLTIWWTQLGSSVNHVLALYENAGDLLACDAGMLVDCHRTEGVLAGSYTLSGLAKKKYHLVIDADGPGAEGVLGLQLVGQSSP